MSNGQKHCHSLVALAAVVVAGTAVAVLHGQQGVTEYPLRMTPTRAEAIVRAWNEGLDYVPGEVLIKFRDGADPGPRSRVLGLVRPRDAQQNVRWIGTAALATTDISREMASALAVLRSQPEVEWAQPNYWHRLRSVPNDPSYSRQWNLDLIQMPRAWDINPGSAPTVTVAVIDSGITTTDANVPFVLWTGLRFENTLIPFRRTPDIAAGRIAGGRDFMFWDGPVLDMVGHGTHVAGTILQETNNGTGLAGIAYRARLLPLKACVGYWEIQIMVSALRVPGFVDPREGGGCDTASVAEAIRFAADAGARVINLSLGGPGVSPVYLDALRYAVGRGAFVAIAVGNEFEEGNPVEYPAAYASDLDGVMSVGAITRASSRASYSNTGAHLEIVAPGGDIDQGGLDGLVFQVGLNKPDFDPSMIVRPRFDRYGEVPNMGTSMATPHVAGLAALLHSQGITNPAAIEAAIKRFARDLGRPGYDEEYGYGLIDARASLLGLGVPR